MMRVVLSASADARALTVSPSSRRATRGSSRSLERRVRLRFSNEQASLAPVRAPPRFRARLPPVRASDSYADETDDALEVFGFSEAWEVEMVRFWRDWNASEARHRVRDLDIKWLVALGRTDRAFARPEIVAQGARKLASLLPDANVPNMLQREPKIVDLNFVRASRSIMELQEVLCDVDKCTDVTPVLERHPRLLMCEDVRGEVEAAKARLHELAPACDAAKAVNEYPELIYRIHQYDEYTELPISIQNIIMETSTEDIVEKQQAYDARWDDWEREECVGDGLCSEGRGLDETDWMNGGGSGAFEHPDAEEWMLDGYHDPDEE